MPSAGQPAWLIADAKAAIEKARAEGVGHDVPVLSAAPALLFDETVKVRAIDGRIAHTQILELFNATLACAADLHQALQDGGFADLALSLARVPVGMQATFYRAMTLTEDMFHAPIAVAELQTGRADLDVLLGSPVAKLLSGNTDARIVKVPLAGAMAGYEIEKTPTLSQRLSTTAVSHIAYRLAVNLGRRTSLATPRGEFWVLRECELLKEAGAWLALRGYGLRVLPHPRASGPQADPGITRRIDAIVGPVFDKHIAPLLAPSCRPMARTLFQDRAHHVAAEFTASLAFWRTQLEQRSARRCRGVLSNALATPQATALFHACREKGVPFIMFQHGVTHEICERVAALEPLLEINAADCCVTFNKESARVQSKSLYRAGKAAVAGLPRAYYRQSGRYGRSSEIPPIWYVSTCVYTGSFSLLHLGVPDLEKARTEMHLLDDVLGRLPHRVLYKPYPGERYVDPDPVTAHAGQFSNIDVNRERLDLRYFGRAARVIVTGRAGGTTAWCLMLGRPMVFINHPEQAPLRADVRPLFEAGIFTFDAARPGWERELHAFLSQPIEAIEQQWVERAPARRQFIAEYIDHSAGHSAGRRAARIVMEAVRTYRQETADAA